MSLDYPNRNEWLRVRATRSACAGATPKYQPPPRSFVMPFMPSTRQRRHDSEHGKWYERPTFNPAGTKLVKRFIKRAKGEATSYRMTLLASTGEKLP